MIYPHVTFQVRINERASLSEIAQRVERVLQCRFSPSDNNFFAGDEAVEATMIGLWITLSPDPEASQDEVRNFVLMGSLKGDIEAQWDIASPNISISEYILGLLLTADSGCWYIPNKEELYEEAGLISDEDQQIPAQVQPVEAPSAAGLKTVAALLGRTPEELESHPEGAGEVLPVFLDRLLQVFRAIASGDPGETEAAREFVQSVQERLKANGIDTMPGPSVAESGGEQENKSWWREADAQWEQAMKSWNVTDHEQISNLAEGLKAALAEGLKKQETQGAGATSETRTQDKPAGQGPD